MPHSENGVRPDPSQVQVNVNIKKLDHRVSGTRTTEDFFQVRG